MNLRDLPTTLRALKDYLLLLLTLRVLRSLTILCLKYGNVRANVQELLDLAGTMDDRAEEIVLKRSGLWRRHG